MTTRGFICVLSSVVSLLTIMVIMMISSSTGLALTPGVVKFLVFLGCVSLLSFFLWLDAEVDYRNGRE